MDLSRASLHVAARHTHRNGCPDAVFACGRAETLPFADASFDVVWCTDVLEHLPNLPTAIDQIARVLLDPGGPFAANAEGVNVILTRPEDLVPDPAERTPPDRQGRVLVAGPAPEGGAHPAQGLDDPVHGPPAEGGVPRQDREEWLRRQDAAQETKGGPGVPRVQDLLGLPDLLGRGLVLLLLELDQLGRHGVSIAS